MIGSYRKNKAPAVSEEIIAELKDIQSSLREVRNGRKQRPTGSRKGRLPYPAVLKRQKRAFVAKF